MKHFTKVLIASCLFGFETAVQAQNSNPASGGNGTGAGGTLAYTIGQLVYTIGSGTGGSVFQGVQAPFEISVLTGIEKTEGIILEFSVYPNPASSAVTLKVESYISDNLGYRIYDLNGMLVQSKKVNGIATIIPLTNLVPGSYLLQISDNNKEVKTFKIIKK